MHNAESVLASPYDSPRGVQSRNGGTERLRTTQSSAEDLSFCGKHEQGAPPQLPEQPKDSQGGWTAGLFGKCICCEGVRT